MATTNEAGRGAGGSLTEREMAVLLRIREQGAFSCTGGCEQRRPDQLHCVHLARELVTSNHKIWKVVGSLAERGLLDRRWDEGGRCWRFTLTPIGHAAAARVSAADHGDFGGPETQGSGSGTTPTPRGIRRGRVRMRSDHGNRMD